MAKPIQIGDVRYPTKKAAQEAIRMVLYRYEIGAIVGQLDREFLLNLLVLHPESSSKIGCGVATIHVEQNEGSRGFWLTRVDGTRTDFSYLACLRPPTHREETLAAFRSAIRSQIEEFRERIFAMPVVTCAVTGAPLDRSSCHIDHAVPFLDLVVGFLSAIGGDFDGINVVPTSDGSTEARLAHAGISEAWVAWHGSKAVLRPVSKTVNLGLLRRGAR